MHAANRCAMASSYSVSSNSLPLLKVSSFIATSNGLLTVYRSDVIATRLKYTERNIVGSNRVRELAKAKVRFFLSICLDEFFQIFRYPSAEMCRCIIMSR